MPRLAYGSVFALTSFATMLFHDAAAATIDFETPPLGAPDRQLIAEFAADGVTFTAFDSCANTALGLARETALTECAIGLPINQMLVTGLGRSVPRAQHIRLDFTGNPMQGVNVVSVEVLTLSGSTVSLRLFDSIGVEVTNGSAVAIPAFEGCGDDSTLTARATVWALAPGSVAYALVDAGPPPGFQCGAASVCGPCAPGFGLDNVKFMRIDATTVDFELPDLGSDSSRIIDPYVTDGATFTALHAGTEIGLVRECRLTSCGTCGDQLLGTYGSFLAPPGIGYGEEVIRVDFAPGARSVTCVGAEFQTLAYSTIGLHLYDAPGRLIGTAQGPVSHAYPTCGSADEGEITARGIVQAQASEPAAYALLWIIAGWTCPFVDCNPFSISRLTYGDCSDCNPIPETCDGLDNDCDGTADNGFALGEACSAGVGECGATGITVCSADGSATTCNAVPGNPTAEFCDGLDNDCDGRVDEGLGPGALAVSLDPGRLWPPNHRMVDIHATVALSGGCPAACPTPPAVVLMAATNSESDDANGVGDGQTINDIQDATLGSTDFDLRVRAERDGTSEGRLYELVYAATDCFGDTAVGSGGILVPHDQGGQTEPVVLEVLPSEGGGAGSHELRWSPVTDTAAYNVLRGRMSTIRTVGSFTVIQDSECLASGLTGTSLSGGSFNENPTPGEAFFYLTEYVNAKGSPSGYGTESAGRELVITSGDVCH